MTIRLTETRRSKNLQHVSTRISGDQSFVSIEFQDSASILNGLVWKTTLWWKIIVGMKSQGARIAYEHLWTPSSVIPGCEWRTVNLTGQGQHSLNSNIEPENDGFQKESRSFTTRGPWSGSNLVFGGGVSLIATLLAEQKGYDSTVVAITYPTTRQ